MGILQKRSLKNLVQHWPFQRRFLIFFTACAGLLSLPFLLGSTYIFGLFKGALMDSGISSGALMSVWFVVQQAITVVLGLWFVSLLLLMMTVVLFSHRLAGPIRLLHEALSRMGAGDFSTSVHLRKTDELQELALEIEKLREKLASERPNQKGMSLIELMIVIGIMGVISLGIGTLVQNMTQMQKTVTLSLVRNEILNEYSTLLNMPTAVQTTLTNNAALAAHANGTAPAPVGDFGLGVAVNNLDFYDQNGELAVPAGGLLLQASGAKCFGPAPPPPALPPVVNCPVAIGRFRVAFHWVAGAGTAYSIRASVDLVEEGNMMGIRSLFTIRNFNGNGAGDAFNVIGSNEVNGLTPGERYIIIASGFTANRGQDQAWFHGLRAKDCAVGGLPNLAPFLYQQFATPGNRVRINWPDGHAPTTHSFVINAPASGCIRVYTDRHVGGFPGGAESNFYTLSVVKIN